MTIVTQIVIICYYKFISILQILDKFEYKFVQIHKKIRKGSAYSLLIL